jgi:outer membrane protein OmpA-like peptidoglycan-associated protein
VIRRGGGPVTVLPAPGQATYPGTTRNRLSSSNYGQYPASFRFKPGEVVANAAPVQAPIASTIKATGQVQLYILFRINSADIDATSTPVLTELQAALQADPQLRLTLIGHTDNTGAATYNKTLSFRRADAVRNWLVGHGISSGRLTADGRGQEEPIADNATEDGRAVNRRVQAVRPQ